MPLRQECLPELDSAALNDVLMVLANSRSLSHIEAMSPSLMK